MLGHDHFYHESLKKAISIFGTIFNDIEIVKRDSSNKELSRTRVPLSYGPKQKFLARLQQENDLEGQKVAIKIPRMSFEMNSLSYDTDIKLNKHNKVTFTDITDSNSKLTTYTYAPYILNMQLNIIVKNQNEGLQILEQIIPYFQPEYTVSYYPLNTDSSDDMPIVLNGISIEDDYTGDFLTRRAIIYTLDFSIKVRFYGPIENKGIIRKIYTSFLINEDDETPVLEYESTTDPSDAEQNDEWVFKTTKL